MAYDRKEFLAKVTERAQERNAGMLPVLRQLQAVAPVMQKLLTGSDTWDRYLTYLQGFIEQAQAAKTRAQALIGGPEASDPQVLARLRVDIIVADAMTEAWQLAIELPKGLIDGATEASKIITRFEKNDEQTAGKADS